MGNKGSKITVLLLVLIITGCSFSPKPAKRVIVEDVTSSNKVKRGIHLVDLGESLYSIAFRYGRDFRNLAAINNMQYPYKIVPGQKIYLNKTTYNGTEIVSKSKKINRKSTGKHNLNSKPSNKIQYNQVVKQGTWVWPIKGKIISEFRDNNRFNKGIDIAVNAITPVKASDNGVVVYRGTGLKGYGKLIIIKHGEHYLSAYAHNDKFLIKEGQRVKKGEHIAVIGRDEKKLHYEIRKNGKPINPVQYLSKS